MGINFYSGLRHSLISGSFSHDCDAYNTHGVSDEVRTLEKSNPLERHTAMNCRGVGIRYLMEKPHHQ